MDIVIRDNLNMNRVITWSEVDGGEMGAKAMKIGEESDHRYLLNH